MIKIKKSFTLHTINLILSKELNNFSRVIFNLNWKNTSKMSIYFRLINSKFRF